MDLDKEEKMDFDTMDHEKSELKDYRHILEADLLKLLRMIREQKDLLKDILNLAVECNEIMQVISMGYGVKEMNEFILSGKIPVSGKIPDGT